MTNSPTGENALKSLVAEVDAAGGSRFGATPADVQISKNIASALMAMSVSEWIIGSNETLEDARANELVSRCYANGEYELNGLVILGIKIQVAEDATQIGIKLL